MQVSRAAKLFLNYNKLGWSSFGSRTLSTCSKGQSLIARWSHVEVGRSKVYRVPTYNPFLTGKKDVGIYTNTLLKTSSLTSLICTRNVNIPKIDLGDAKTSNDMPNELENVLSICPEAKYRDVLLFENNSNKLRYLLMLFPAMVCFISLMWIDIALQFFSNDEYTPVYVVSFGAMAAAVFFGSHALLTRLIRQIVLLKDGQRIKIDTSNYIGTRSYYFNVSEFKTKDKVFGSQTANGTGLHVGRVYNANNSIKKSFLMDTEAIFDKDFDRIFYKK